MAVVIAFLAGMLTLLSPCTLPVIPLVFASVRGRKGQIILLLFGMGLMFTAVSLLATAAGGWLVNLTIVGRWLALWLSVCCHHALQAGSDRQRLRWVINLTNRAIVMAVGSLQCSPDWRLDYFGRRARDRCWGRYLAWRCCKEIQ